MNHENQYQLFEINDPVIITTSEPIEFGLMLNGEFHPQISLLPGDELRLRPMEPFLVRSIDEPAMIWVKPDEAALMRDRIQAATNQRTITPADWQNTAVQLPEEPKP